MRQPNTTNFFHNSTFVVCYSADSKVFVGLFQTTKSKLLKPLVGNGFAKPASKAGNRLIAVGGQILGCIMAS